MKITRIAIALAATLLVAQIATAQMGGGMHRPGSPSNPGPGYGSGPMIGGGFMGAPNELIVAPNGTVFTIRHSASATATAPAIDIVAVLPSGTIAWSTTLAGGTRNLTLAGDLLVMTSGANIGDGIPNNYAAATTQLTALSVVTGAQQWELDLDGRVQAIEPFTGGIYVLLVEHDVTAPATGVPFGPRGGLNPGPGYGYGLGTRTLAAISDAGAVLWTLELN